MSAAPIDESLFTWPSEAPRLRGGRCADCGTVDFPRSASCPRCASERVEDHELARRGTLWTWTVQRFPPKPPYIGPEPFEPYAVGYVELPGEVMVESRLVGAPPEAFAIGMPVELVVVPFTETPDGSPLVTFAFQPATEVAP